MITRTVPLILQKMCKKNPPRPWTSRLCLRCSQHQCPSTMEPRPPCCSRLPWYLQSTISRCLNDVKWYLQSAISKWLNDIKWYLQSTISKRLNDINALHLMSALYDSFSDVPESWVWWRADFQSGSRVLKRCSEPFLIYIYGIQCDFMPKSCWKHSNFENR